MTQIPSDGVSLEAPTLVVVDLQEWIVSSGLIPGVAEAAEKVVAHARERGWGIVFLQMRTETRPHNPVASNLLRAAAGCEERTAGATKDRMGGGEEVFAACDSKRLSTSRFVICGVWLKGCVLQTVREILGRNPSATIDVVVDACNREASEWRSAYEELPGVRLIDSANL